MNLFGNSKGGQWFLGIFFFLLTGLPWAEGATIGDGRLQGAEEDHENWLTYGHGYTNQRYSGLNQVNTNNVGELVPKWIYQTGVLGTFPTNPIVADGVMYITTPYNHVVALDAGTGAEIWKYRHEMSVDRLCCGTHNRGVAIGYGRIYMVTADARLIALDVTNGRVDWDLPIVDPATGNPDDLARLKDMTAAQAAMPGHSGIIGPMTRFAGNMTPVVYDGKVFVGVSGTGYTGVLSEAESDDPSVLGRAGPRRGLRAFLSAYEVESGKLLWRWYSTASEGWEGDFAERTAFGDVLERDIAFERSTVDQYREAWKTGGGSIYSSPSIDVELGLIYFGTGNASPGYEDFRRPGDNLYTASLIALDVQTGTLRWYHQIVPHDIWGYDVATPPVLIDYTAKGERVRAVAQASKTGWVYILDRITGKPLLRSEPFVPQNELLFRRPNRGGVFIAPGAAGGANWPPASYSQRTGWLYVSGTHNPTKYQLVPKGAGDPDSIQITFDEEVEKFGTLTAIDPLEGGIKWQAKTRLPLVSGSVATKGGLVFHGQSDGMFVGRNAKTGEKLWEFNTGAGVNAPPITYAIGDSQLIAVAAGGHKLFKFPLGDAVIAFGLPD